VHRAKEHVHWGCVSVGTLKQGYPLPQYEGTTPAERSLVAERTVLRRATSTAPRSPRGHGKGRALGYPQWVRTYRKESTGPPYVTDRPPGWVPHPSEWGPDYSPPDPEILGQRIPEPCSGRGPGATCVQTQLGANLSTQRSYSLGRRSPSAAKRPTVRDVSLRDGPDVRPLGRTALAFIVVKTRRLTTPLIGDVPLQHLMRPVHSTGSGAQAILQAADLTIPVGQQYTCVVACTAPIMAHALPRALQQDINIVCTTDIMAHGDYTGMASSSSILPFVPGPACRGSEPLYMPPLNYKRGGMQH
jgi:hypothetical protein